MAKPRQSRVVCLVVVATLTVMVHCVYKQIGGANCGLYHLGPPYGSPSPDFKS